MTDESLAELFGEAGVVKSAKIQLKPDGLRRGWGYVNKKLVVCWFHTITHLNFIDSCSNLFSLCLRVVKFDTSEEAQRAIELFHGRVLHVKQEK
jgi:RNA recognition motif-containing protein